MNERDRSVDRLIARVTEGSPQDHARVHDVEAEELELAAAAIFMAYAGTCDPEPMPERVKRRILEQALSDRSG